MIFLVKGKEFLYMKEFLYVKYLLMNIIGPLPWIRMILDF